jgi:nicotinamidase-related amidase
MDAADMVQKTKTWLGDIFNSNAFDIRRCAHVAVDVQREYCEEYVQEADRIGTFAAALNNMGIHTYWVYYKQKDKSPMEAHGGLYRVQPAANDRIIGKEAMSAFAGSNIDEILKADGMQMLLVTGFYSYACASTAAVDGSRKGYDVVFLTDCTNNPELIRAYLNRENIPMESSRNVLADLQKNSGRRFMELKR